MPQHDDGHIKYALEGVADDLKSIKNDIALVHNLLTGNGEPAKGLIVRFDRVEQSYQNASRWITFAITISVGSIMGNAGLIIKLLFFGS